MLDAVNLVHFFLLAPHLVHFQTHNPLALALQIAMIIEVPNHAWPSVF
jgi:hypothetical protein